MLTRESHSRGGSALVAIETRSCVYSRFSWQHADVTPTKRSWRFETGRFGFQRLICPWTCLLTAFSCLLYADNAKSLASYFLTGPLALRHRIQCCLVRKFYSEQMFVLVSMNNSRLGWVLKLITGSVNYSNKYKFLSQYEQSTDLIQIVSESERNRRDMLRSALLLFQTLLMSFHL